MILVVLLSGLPTHADEQRDKFDAQFRQAQALFKQDKLAEAYAAVQSAARVDPSRYEASGFAALVLLKDGKFTAAREALADARKLAPATAKKKLDDIGLLIETAAAKSTAPDGKTTVSGGVTSQASSTTPLTGAARRKYDTLLVIVEEADQAKSAAERRKLLDELLFKSGEFVREFPDVLSVWTLRAAAALELEQERMAWEASSEMIRLGAENSDDPKVRQLVAKLDRKGWLKTKAQMAEAIALEEKRLMAVRAEDERKRAGEKDAAEAKWKTMLEKGFENSLGMKFVPVPNTEVLFCIWETRVQDYKAYLRASGQESNFSWRMLAAGVPKRAPRNIIGGIDYGSYESPTDVFLPSSPTHPVIDLKEAEILAFCEWLTKKERAEGRLHDQIYRLPTVSEWCVAAGNDPKKKHLWGDEMPPRSKVGNLASTDMATVFNQNYLNSVEGGYRDGHAATAPVGSYVANAFGIYDMIGNVEEPCFLSTTNRKCCALGGHWMYPQAFSVDRNPIGGFFESSFYSGFRIVLAKTE